MKITFLDMEFANTKTKSICQIGILCKDLDCIDKPAETRNLYIDPEDTFDSSCVAVHHIDEAKVKGAASFKDLWNDLERFFTNAIVVGHNVAPKNLDALYHNLIRYQIEVPKMYYLCTYHCAQKHLSPFLVSDYALDTLCQYYGIPLHSKHNAFYNACAISDLFDCMILQENIEYQDEIRLFFPQEDSSEFGYTTNGTLSGDIQNFYGVIKGITLDEQISDEEVLSLKEWGRHFSVYKKIPYITEILDLINQVLEDDVVTVEEIKRLQFHIRKYLNATDTSAATLATHVLGGIIKGIVTDDDITEEECFRLRDWLYENCYLAGHYPFDRMFEKVESILKDGVLTKQEADSIKEEIRHLLEPVEKLKKDILSLDEKRVCLIGYKPSKQKTALEQYVLESGGILSSKMEDADYVVVKDEKVAKKTEKLLAENESVQFLKEHELCLPEKSFCDVLLGFIDERGMGDAETYKKARLPRQMMSKIKCNPDYKPEKKNICSFAIALELDVEQTNLLLSSAGYILSPNIVFDRIVRSYILKKDYNIDRINESLYEIGASTLLS